MSWSVIRYATSEDIAAVKAAREKFIKRHGDVPMAHYICESDNEPISDMRSNDTPRYANLDWNSKSQEERKMRRAWRAALRKALNTSHADGIAYGAVGYSVR